MGNAGIHQMCLDGNVQGVRQYLAKGGNPNAVNTGKMTPLILASSTGNQEIVQMLLNAGAHVNDISAIGFTALMAAGMILRL